VRQEADYHSQEFTPVFSGVTVTQSLVFCLALCQRVFDFFSFFFLAFVLCVLIRITVSDYPHGIFKLYFRLILIYYNDYSLDDKVIC
jgi:hypothetical protein